MVHTSTFSFPVPSLVMTMCTLLLFVNVVAAAAAEVDNTSDKGGMLTSIKVAMGVVLGDSFRVLSTLVAAHRAPVLIACPPPTSVFFIFLVVGFCFTGRKRRTHADSVLPTTNPAANNRPTYVARSKSLRSWLSGRSGHSSSSVPQDVALSRVSSRLSLSGETVVDVPLDSRAVTPQAPPRAYIPSWPDAARTRE